MDADFIGFPPGQAKPDMERIRFCNLLRIQTRGGGNVGSGEMPGGGRGLHSECRNQNQHLRSF